ncbi:hypothetical protein ACP70R_021423 [Stipagrostis hirtigluma subsp. patula]
MDDPAPAKRAKGAGQPTLPEEIVEDILARLPAKSVLRFQAVSRSWRAVVTSPAFRDLHSRRADRRGTSLFVRPAGRCTPFYAWRPGGGDGRDVVDKIMDHSCRLPQGQLFPITRSCHGLVILRCPEYSTHYVWNPSTRETLALPERTPLKAAGYEPFPSMPYGMGYCSATGRYKVVRMYCLFQPDATTTCEVFILNESAYWRPAAAAPPAGCSFARRRNQGAALCNGNLHFVGDDGAIVTFSVTDETFGTLMPPPELMYTGFDLMQLDGCLCAYLPSQLDPMLKRPYCVWLLRDYTANGSRWEKLCCMDWGAMTEAERAPLQSRWIAPLGMYHDGTSVHAKKIMFGTGSCKVFAVDPCNGALEMLFSMDGSPSDGKFPTMGLFEDSLVPVGRTTDEIILSSTTAQAWWPVLTNLPARTVGRLTQVCKDWRAIIKNECFVDEHLYRSNLNRSPRIMFTDGRPNGFKSMEDFINTFDTPPLVDDASKVVCSKSCHGLHAGSLTYYDFVCNPSTGYYKALLLEEDGELRGTEIDDYIATRTSHHSRDAMFTGHLGLGYDMEMGLHVLVRLTYKERNFTTRDYKLQCKIQYVGDMFWDELDPPQRPIANAPPAHANGKIYWMVDTELGQRSSGLEVVVLDVTTRKFEVLQGPPCGHGNNHHVSIVELHGVICVACSHRRVGAGAVEIWAMKDAGSWYLEHCIQLNESALEYSSEMITPLAMNPKNGRILLSTGRALAYYSPKTAEMEMIYCLGKYGEGKKFVPILFQESLFNPCDQIP